VLLKQQKEQGPIKGDYGCQILFYFEIDDFISSFKSSVAGV